MSKKKTTGNGAAVPKPEDGEKVVFYVDGRGELIGMEHRRFIRVLEPLEHRGFYSRSQRL